MKFLIENLYLIVIALVSGGLLLWPLVRRGGGSTALSPLLATQLINHRNAIVVDVRDDKAFASGSLAGARNIPFAVLADRASELVRFKGRPVLIVCESGQQSAKAIATFKGQGFEEAHSLAGGIAAWKQAALPLVVPGRDNSRPVLKDNGRRQKNDRTNERSKAARPPRALPPTVSLEKPVAPVIAAPVISAPVLSVAPVADAPVASGGSVAANDAPESPGRAKGIS